MDSHAGGSTTVKEGSVVILLEPFRIIGQLEGGGLGQLFVCVDATNVRFAAKLPKDSSAVSQQLVFDEARRFVRHQGKLVVRYFGPVHHADGRVGFAMELMEGSLAGLVATRGALPVRTALVYFSHAARAIAEVHVSAPGAFHGDVKLANLLYKAGVVKLADFGLARGGVGQTTVVGPHSGGTPGYFPPEGYASPAGDVYALGAVLYAMVSGREPHPVRGPVLTQPLNRQLAALLGRMLCPDPATRPTINTVLLTLPGVIRAVEAQERADRAGDLALGVGLVAGVALLAAVLSGA